jgi:hypothetical protein
MPIGKNSIRSRTKRRRRKLSKILTPDLALSHGKLLHFVAGPDDPLSEAERVCGEFAEMVEDQHAAVRQFLQRAYFVADKFRRRPRDFERFQVHSFWKQTRQKPKDPTKSKWVPLFLMQATTTRMRIRASKYALVLDGLKQDQVEISAVAARIQELGGVDAAYEAMRARTTRHESCVTQDPQNKRTPAMAWKSQQPVRPTIRTAKLTDGARSTFDGDAAGPKPAYCIKGPFAEKIPLSSVGPFWPPRKLNNLDRWGTRISQCKAQLPQARTKEERDPTLRRRRGLSALRHVAGPGRKRLEGR